MKKISFVILLILLLFASCTHQQSFELQENGTLTTEGKVFYPIENSYRFTDYGRGKKCSEVDGNSVYVVEGNEGIVLVESQDSYTYYVDEKHKGFDKAFEECNEFLYVPASKLDKQGRADKKYLQKASRLTGEDAVDFSFYIFYGRTPEEWGYKVKTYAGEIYGTFDEMTSLVSSYPVYKYSPKAYSVEIDGIEYLMEIALAKEIGIITE